jgi:hypothetical protein
MAAASAAAAIQKAAADDPPTPAAPSGGGPLQADLMAAMAPRPLLVSEGGRTEDLERVLAAYRLAGAADCFRWEYYPKYAAAKDRLQDRKSIPEGLTAQEYWQGGWCNVDASNHHFKHEVAVPWLEAILAEPAKPSAGRDGRR